MIMFKGIARGGAALAIASLLVTACAGGGDPAPAPRATPAGHPVFDQKLDRQMLLALRQSQKAGSAAFTQTLTLETKKGRAVQTVKGRMDFAANTGEATTGWQVPEKYPEDAKDAILGRAPGSGYADATGRFLVDGQHITYRAGSATYWLRYASGDYDPSDKTIDQLRGTEAPVGGTLLEGLGGAEAKSRQGTRYRAEMPAQAVWNILPGDFATQLSTELSGFGLYRSARPVPLTAELDARGRVTRVHADLKDFLGKKGSAFPDATSLTLELAVTGYGTSKPAARADGRVLDAGRTVRRIHTVEPGHCLDFSTGQRDTGLVADIPCDKPHDARLFGQVSFGGSAYPGDSASQRQAERACDRAYYRAPDRWTSEADESGHYWFMHSGPDEWQRAGEGRATCYVVTARGNS